MERRESMGTDFAFTGIDHAAIEACRRVIDAELNGTVAGSSDTDLVLGYFR